MLCNHRQRYSDNKGGEMTHYYFPMYENEKLPCNVVSWKFWSICANYYIDPSKCGSKQCFYFVSITFNVLLKLNYNFQSFCWLCLCVNESPLPPTVAPCSQSVATTCDKITKHGVYFLRHTWADHFAFCLTDSPSVNIPIQPVYTLSLQHPFSLSLSPAHVISSLDKQ